MAPFISKSRNYFAFWLNCLDLIDTNHNISGFGRFLFGKLCILLLSANKIATTSLLANHKSEGI